jgi:hypothetical protein
VQIPERIERAVGAAVTAHLETELGDRGLLLPADRLIAAQVEAARRGERLLTRVVDRCYRIDRERDDTLVLEFHGERTQARLVAALAFGAATAGVLGPRGRRRAGTADDVELLCAVFNLGIGLVDGLCDGDAETGGRLLEILRGRDLAAVARARHPRGWLRAAVPAALADDATAAFTVDIIEVFFETLHAVYPDEARSALRRAVGAQLDAALEAERRSVDRTGDGTAREELIECSRGTSVLPYQIIQTLAAGRRTPAEPAAATLLGEAMWLIDDLVDLCHDARSGALNGLLLAAAEEPGRPDDRGRLAALERMLASTDIARAAARAADGLLAALRRAGGGRAAAADHPPTRSLLHFIQRYAGIAPPSDVRDRRRAPGRRSASPPSGGRPRPDAR